MSSPPKRPNLPELRWFVVYLFWVVLVVAPKCALSARNDDARFVDGLRQRRLYSLAEDFCQERLVDENLSEVERSETTLELIRTLAAHAADSPPSLRLHLWDQARQTAGDYLREHPGAPRLVLIRVQDALTLLARGELLRQESKVLPSGDEIAETAKGVLRDASRALATVAEDLSREIPLRHRGTDQPGELSAQELISLQHHVRYHQARAFRNRALCYAADTTDRVAMLTQAVDVLKQALTQIDANDALANRMRIDLAACYRSLADFASAERALAMVRSTAPGQAVQLDALAEAMRLELARHRPEQALVHVGQGRKLAATGSAQFDFACLETCIAMWRKSRDENDETAAGTWRKQSVAMVKQIEQLHGPYWGRRADLLLVQAIGGSGGAADAEVLVRTADNLYRLGQLDEAVSAYEQAAAVAGEAGDLEQAFSLRYKAALVEHSRQHHRAAADKLRSLGSDMPTNEKAADVHLLAAWNAAQLSRSDPAALPLYERILTEHLATWPAKSTSNTARLWLGRLRESQGDFAAAADAYQGVSRDAPQYDQAMRAAARCSHSHIDRLRNSGQSYREFAESVALFFEEQIRGLLDDGSKTWTPTERFCAEQAARFWLETDSSGYRRAESVVSAALAGVPDPEPAWKNTAASVLIVALAGQQGKRAQAEATLLRLGDSSSDQLLEILSAVAEIQESSTESTKQELAGLQLAIVDKLSDRRSQLDPATLRSLDRIRAEALVLAGRRDEALATYARLASENPDDGPIQEAYAEQLVAAGDQESMQAALQQWRRVASRSNAHSERWYRAKYGIVSALHALGKKEEAADRIRYLLTIPPGVKDAKWKTRFETLLTQCE